MSLRYNALVLAVLTVLIAIAGTWSGDATVAGLWRLPLGLLFLGLAYEGWVASRTRVRLAIDADGRAVLGRPLELELRITHDGTREVAAEIAAAAPEGVETDATVRGLSISPGAGSQLHVSVVPRRLGTHAWPGVRARIAGPLGLAWWSRRLVVDFALRVVPNLLGAEAGSAGAAAAGTRARSFVGAGNDILQLRDYRSGDPLHMIDWKATARSGRLISREHSTDQHLEIVIALDAGRTSALRAGHLDRLGHFVNLSAQFAEHAVAHDDRVGLVIFADRPIAALPPGRGMSAVLKIRNLLGSLQPLAAESNPLNAAMRVRTLVRHRSLVVVLTDLDDATVAGQLASAARLLLPKHLPLIAGLSSPEAEALSEAEARSWLDPYESLAAQEYTARLGRNVRALRMLGAPTLVARPDQLQRAVFDAYAEFRHRHRV